LDKYEYVKKILEASGLDYKQFTKHKYRPQIKTQQHQIELLTGKIRTNYSNKNR